eukprot:TRINITY_DN2447_c0_g1_i2.p1 TRINITY_DN2447_c0_g1~~TRINITY_DN2447_c0_g1_i2.p1  ORF type:complete len:621 (-),score=127.56 TRINITY_DN2447_c0_g1_i2:125-1987(-)
MVKQAGKKRKKTEKAKVHLRTPSAQKTPLSNNKKKSFKLPKGRNELDTHVNAKSLFIKSQLANEDASGPSTSKNLPLKHYIIKLKHYARANRLDGLRGIREILTAFPETARESLCSLIYKVSPLLSDPDNEVGREAGKELSLIVSLVDKESLSPFYSALCAHLCVALSHIDQSVQRTGLKALDTFIQNIPDFILGSYRQILPSLLNQISVGGNEGMRKLSNNVDCGKMTLLQWRTEVLERLCGLFQALRGNEVDSCIKEEDENKSISFNDEDPFIYGRVPSNSNLESIPMECLEGDSLRVVKAGESFSLSSFAQNLLPLLFETWKEAYLSSGASGKRSSQGVFLPSDNSKVFLVVADILQLLTIMLRREPSEKLRARMTKNIYTHLLPGFPYHSSKSKDSLDVSPIINLKIASVYLDTAIPFKPEIVEKILDYNQSICDSRGSDTDDIYYELLSSLSNAIIIKNQFPSFIKRMDQLLLRSIELQPRNSALIQLLSELSSFKDSRERSETVSKWITELPRILVDSSLGQRENIVSAIQKLQKQNNALLLEAFAAQMDFVMDNLKKNPGKSSSSHKKTLQLLCILSYRLQKIFPKLNDLIEEANDSFTSSFHANLNGSISVC